MRVITSKTHFVLLPTTIKDLGVLSSLLRVNEIIEFTDYREPLVNKKSTEKLDKQPIRLQMRIMKTYLRGNTLVIAGLLTLGSRFHHYTVIFGKQISVLRRITAVEKEYLTTYCREERPLWIVNIACDKWVLLKLYDCTYQVIKEQDISYGSTVVSIIIAKFSDVVFSQIKEILQKLSVTQVLLITSEMFAKFFTPRFRTLPLKLHEYITEVLDFEFVKNQFFYRSATIKKISQLHSEIRLQDLFDTLLKVKLIPDGKHIRYEECALIKKAYMTAEVYYAQFNNWQTIGYPIEIVPSMLIEKLNTTPLFYEVYYLLPYAEL